MRKKPTHPVKCLCEIQALAVASRGRREAERLVQEMQSHREAVLESLLAGAAPRMREKSTKLSLVQNGCATIFLGERQEELLRRSAQLLERARWEQPHDDKLSRSQTLTSNTQIAGTKHVFDAGLQRSEYVALRTEFEKLQSDLAASQAESQVSRKQVHGSELSSLASYRANWWCGWYFFGCSS